MSETQNVIDLTEAGAHTDAPGSTGAAIDADGAVSLDAAEAKAKGLPERCVVNDDGSITLPLFVALTLTWKQGSETTPETVDSVTLRRLTGKDVRTILSAGAKDYVMTLTAAAVRAQFNSIKWGAIFDRLDGADAQDLTQIALYFLENGPKTPSPR